MGITKNKTKLSAMVGGTLAVIIVALFLIISSVEASTVNYCENCGARLSTSGQYMNGWATYHHFYDYNGNYVSCRVDHVVTRYSYYCPNGHGVKDVEDIETINHNHPSCNL